VFRESWRLGGMEREREHRCWMPPAREMNGATLGSFVIRWNLGVNIVNIKRQIAGVFILPRS
jgi:hypothetical protein